MAGAPPKGGWGPRACPEQGVAAGQSVLEEWVAVGQGGREKTEAGGVPAPPAKGNHTEPRLLGTPKKVAGFPLSEYEQRDQLGGGGG